MGEVLLQSSTEKESIEVTEINPFEAENKMITQFNNVITDRRSELYSL
jgi:hypothetical protein